MLAPLLLNVAAQTQPLPIAWGFATSALQIEGSWNVDGKGLNIWDVFFSDPARANDPNHFVAIDHYKHMKSDIAYLGQLGATMYRFSVSWARILPDCTGKVNEQGIQFYSDMIDEIIKNGAVPVLTLFHWDTPQACQAKYGSWLSEQITDDFANFADVVFSRLGDRLEYILTINEPGAECGWGFANNFWPPAVSQPNGKFVCQHWSNLAHGKVVQMARKKYANRNFKFGMPLIIPYAEPATSSSADVLAAERLMRENAVWNWGPLVDGDYPAFLKNEPTYGANLPQYTQAHKDIMKNTMDFVAVNYYSASWAANAPGKPFNYTTEVSKPALGPTSGTSWQTVYAPGLRGLLRFLHKEYPSLDLIVTECGTSGPGEQNLSPQQQVNDQFRLDFFKNHLQALSDAVLLDKLPVKGFLAWSLFDNFEWRTYDQRFGVIGIDFNSTDRTRRVKNSASYISSFFKSAKSPIALPKASTTTTTPNNGIPSSTPAAKSAAVNHFSLFSAIVAAAFALN
ncbi:glycoside hydrolase superfamily [Gorgonomyces haynaldii]|nr:glycoside hydrolase superfamily [Gorgonomyces haynaldii]